MDTTVYLNMTNNISTNSAFSNTLSSSPLLLIIIHHSPSILAGVHTNSNIMKHQSIFLYFILLIAPTIHNVASSPSYHKATQLTQFRQHTNDGYTLLHHQQNILIICYNIVMLATKISEDGDILNFQSQAS